MKIILAIITTLLLMFATSFLLDIQIIKANWVRQAIVYVFILTQLVVGFKVVRYMITDI